MLTDLTGVFLVWYVVAYVLHVYIYIIDIIH